MMVCSTSRVLQQQSNISSFKLPYKRMRGIKSGKRVGQLMSLTRTDRKIKDQLCYQDNWHIIPPNRSENYFRKVHIGQLHVLFLTNSINEKNVIPEKLQNILELPPTLLKNKQLKFKNHTETTPVPYHYVVRMKIQTNAKFVL